MLTIGLLLLLLLLHCCLSRFAVVRAAWCWT
jgi:hypothetical protein